MMTGARPVVAAVAMAAVLVIGALAGVARGDWPTHRGDNGRTAASDETIDARRLVAAWVHEPASGPRPAWPGPAKWDAYASLKGMKSMRNYDPVFHTTIVGDEGGGRVYYGSSAEDTVVCLDAVTGREVWTFIAGGPVRVAPSIIEGVAYFGADDGYAYAVDAATGDLKWKFCPTAGLPDGQKRVLNNGRLISFYPVRTGVMVDQATAYFGASLLPWKSSYLVAVDAATGKAEGAGRYVRDLGLDQTLEAAMLCTDDRLIAPRGRVAPMLFDRKTGEMLGALPGGGGSFVVLTDENRVLHGPGNKTPKLYDAAAETRESVSSYESGHAIVVRDGVSYLLGDETLAALDRQSGALKWIVESEQPYELVMAGRGDEGVLFAGGVDEVVAYSVRNGEVLARLPVRGRVQGISIGAGRVVASTDVGVIHVFAEGEASEGPYAVRPGAAGEPASGGADAEEDRALDLSVPDVFDDDLLHRWVFQRDAAGAGQDGPPGFVNFGAQDRGPGPAARTGELPTIVRAGAREVLAFDGTFGGLRVADDFRAIDLPTREISVEAWVRIDEPMQWGGIINCIQDNGGYEHGWILGFNGDKPSFGLNGASDPVNSITYLASTKPFTKKAWHHVVGTYDGAAQRVYMDGELVAESVTQKGDISYPDAAVVHVGAYKDTDEDFRMKGALREVRVYTRALSAEEVKKNAGQERATLPEPEAPAAAVELAKLVAGPVISFVPGQAAEVIYETDRPSRSRVTVHYAGPGAGTMEPAAREVSRPGRSREHRVRIEGLRKDTPYEIAIHVDGEGDRSLATQRYLMDTTFDFTRSSGVVRGGERLGAELTSAVASIERARAEAGSPGPGHAVIVGVGTGELGLALAKHSGMRVTVLERGAAKVDGLRRMYHAAGAHGWRVAVIDLDEVPPEHLPAGIADVVLSETAKDRAGVSDADWALMQRLASPDGGLVMLGEGGAKDVAWVRPALPGSAPWRHMYGEANNRAFAGEELAGAGATDELEVTWVGEPGPRYQSDRGNRKPAPLAENGHVFTQGLNRIIAVDAYNGTIRWAVELPELQRFNIPRDTSNWCTDGSHVFLAMGDRCYRVSHADGSVEKLAEVVRPRGASDSDRYEWGYLARHEVNGAGGRPGSDLLFGSATKAGGEYVEWWGGAMWYDSKEDVDTAKVCSDTLFALDPDTASQRWLYDAKGLIINSTITIQGGSVWFLESGDAAAKAAASRRVNSDDFWNAMEMVCLDAETGLERWRKPLRGVAGAAIPAGKIAAYIAAAGVADAGGDAATEDGRVIYSISAYIDGQGAIGVYSFRGDTGECLWQRVAPWEKDHHGGHIVRPAIVKDRIYVRPHVIDLTTGEVVHTGFPGGHQCGTYTASSNALYFRMGNLGMWDRTTGQASRFNRLRPDCWISTVPALGMLLSPEGGGGCSCGSWMETSMGLMPVSFSR